MSRYFKKRRLYEIAEQTEWRRNGYVGFGIRINRYVRSCSFFSLRITDWHAIRNNHIGELLSTLTGWKLLIGNQKQLLMVLYYYWYESLRCIHTIIRHINRHVEHPMWTSHRHVLYDSFVDEHVTQIEILSVFVEKYWSVYGVFQKNVTQNEISEKNRQYLLFITDGQNVSYLLQYIREHI